MANAWEIADLMTRGLQGPTGPEDSAFHTGVINTWDTLTGLNTVTVNGVVLSNLKAVHSGIGIGYQPGDVVVVLRKQTQYFVLGKVSAPGGTAGSAVQTNVGAFTATFGTAGAWAGHPSGTVAVTAYIGSSRSCLVFFSAHIKVKVGDTGFGPDIYDPTALASVSFAVSGATTIGANSFAGQTAFVQAENWNAGASHMVGVMATASGFMALGPGQGMNAGTNTFTMRFNTSQTAEFLVPKIIVIPL